MARTKGSTRQVKWLDQSQVKALFRVAEDRPVRDRLLLALTYRYGLRLSEALGLRTEDVDLTRQEIRVVALKGGATRTYALGRDILPLFRKHRPTGAYVVASREGERMSRTRGWQVIKSMMAEAGVPAFSPHALRHSLAVHMLDSGLRLEHVKDALRHSSIRSTEIYAELSSAARAEYAKVMERSGAIVKVR